MDNPSLSLESPFRCRFWDGTSNLLAFTRECKALFGKPKEAYDFTGSRSVVFRRCIHPSCHLLNGHESFSKCAKLVLYGFDDASECRIRRKPDMLVSVGADHIAGHPDHRPANRLDFAPLERLRHQRLLEPDHHVVGDGFDPAEQQVPEQGMLAVLFHRITFFQFINAILDVGPLVVRAKQWQRLEIGICDDGLEGIVGRERHRQLVIGCTLRFVGFPVDHAAANLLPVGQENRDVGSSPTIVFGRERDVLLFFRQRFPECRMLLKVGNRLLHSGLLRKFEDVLPPPFFSVRHDSVIGKTAVGPDAFDDPFRRQHRLDFFHEREQILHAVRVAGIQLQVDQLAASGDESNPDLVRGASVVTRIVAVCRAFLLPEQRDDRVVDVDPDQALFARPPFVCQQIPIQCDKLNQMIPRELAQEAAEGALVRKTLDAGNDLVTGIRLQGFHMRKTRVAEQRAVQQMIDKLRGRVDTVGFLLQMEVIFDQGIQTDEFLEPGKEPEVAGFRDGVVVECDRSQLLHDMLDSATLRKNFNSAFAACFSFWRMVRCLWYHVARDTSSRWLFVVV